MTPKKIRDCQMVYRLEQDAAAEVAFLFQDEDVKEEIERVLKLLAAQDDPRNPPESTGLIVDEMSRDAPGWFRVKVPRSAIRIVFRLLVVRGKQTIDLGGGVLQSNDRGSIDIIHAAYRKDAYGQKLRKRHKRLRGSE
jgi:hypothetical protein